MTASTTLTAATTSAASSAHPKFSTVSTPSVKSAASWRITAFATSTSTNPRTSVSGNRSAASTGGMTAFSAAATAATSSAPPKFSMLTPGRIPAATIKATPVASHDTMSGNTRQRGRSGFHASDCPYDSPDSLGITSPLPQSSGPPAIIGSPDHRRIVRSGGTRRGFGAR